MRKIQKTNAARLLESAGIDFGMVPYEVDPANLAATHVAAQLGEDVRLVYKTLVLHGDRTGYFVCVIPGDREVDLKKAASASGNRKAAMIPMKDLLAVSGYIRGGCTAIGMKKPYPVYMQRDALAYRSFYVSAGQRGLQLRLSPADYAAYTKATACDIVTD